MPRHIWDLLTVQSVIFEKLPSDKEAKLQREWGEMAKKGVSLLHHKKLSALAVKFTLTFSEEVSRNQLRLFSFSWDL